MAPVPAGSSAHGPSSGVAPLMRALLAFCMGLGRALPCVDVHRESMQVAVAQPCEQPQLQWPVTPAATTPAAAAAAPTPAPAPDGSQGPAVAPAGALGSAPCGCAADGDRSVSAACATCGPHGSVEGGAQAGAGAGARAGEGAGAGGARIVAPAGAPAAAGLRSTPALALPVHPPPEPRSVAIYDLTSGSQVWELPLQPGMDVIQMLPAVGSAGEGAGGAGPGPAPPTHVHGRPLVGVVGRCGLNVCAGAGACMCLHGHNGEQGGALRKRLAPCPSLWLTLVLCLHHVSSDHAGSHLPYLLHPPQVHPQRIGASGVAALAFDPAGSSFAALCPSIPCLLVWQLAVPWSQRLGIPGLAHRGPLMLQPTACWLLGPPQAPGQGMQAEPRMHVGEEGGLAQGPPTVSKAHGLRWAGAGVVEVLRNGAVVRRVQVC